MDPHTTAPHLAESDLLQLVAGESDQGARSAGTEHLQECGVCAGRLDTLRQASAQVHDALAELQLPTDFPSAADLMLRAEAAGPPSRSGSVDNRLRYGWLRAAAVVLLLLLPLMMIAPVRAAVVGWVRQGWLAVAGGAPAGPQPARSEQNGVAASAGYTVWFTPVGGQFEILIDTPQSGGQLWLGPVEGSDGSLRVEAGGGASALVTDGRLSIRNEALSEANYQVEVPAGVERVLVRVGDGPPLTVERAVFRRGWSMDLSP